MGISLGDYFKKLIARFSGLLFGVSHKNIISQSLQS